MYIAGWLEKVVRRTLEERKRKLLCLLPSAGFSLWSLVRLVYCYLLFFL